MSKWMMGLATVALLGLAAGLYAQGDAKKEKPTMPQAWGVVKSVDLKANVIVVNARISKTAEPKDMTFALTTDTKVVAGKDGAEAKKLDDLKPDLHVSVLYRPAATGNPTALLIKILPEKKPEGK